MLLTQLEQQLGLLKEGLLSRSDFLIDLSHHALRLLELSFSGLVGRFKSILSRLFASESILGGLELLFSGIKSLHLLLQNLVIVRNIGSLVGKLSGECRQLISQDSNLTL